MRDFNLTHVLGVFGTFTGCLVFAALGLPGMAGFVSEALTLVGAYDSADPRFRILVLISVLGIVITAGFLLWAMQRVFLGTLNEKYKDLPDINFREILCLAPLLFLCVALGIFPHFLLDWMEPSVRHLVGLLEGAAG